MKTFRSSSQTSKSQVLEAQGKQLEGQPVVQHSVLAMRAAKRMSISGQKAEIGHTVCHHLLQMIRESDTRQPNPRASRRYHRSAVKQQAQAQLLSNSNSADLFATEGFGHSFCQEAFGKAANDRQFSLAF